MHDDSATLFVRMPPDLHAAIKEAAAREDRTVSQYIRHIMREHIGPPAPKRRKR